MNTFIVTESRPATYIWVYEVEAENEEEAIKLVKEAGVEIVETDVVIDYDENAAEFDVEEAENEDDE